MCTYRTLGLHIEKVYRETLQHKDHNVHDVELPAQSFDTDRIHILVEDARQRREDEAERQTLGTNVEWQDLNSVRHRQTRPSETGGTIE